MRALQRTDHSDLSIDKTADLLEKREQDEPILGKEPFAIDYRNPKQYHIIINSGLLTIRQEAKIIKSVFRQNPTVLSPLLLQIP